MRGGAAILDRGGCAAVKAVVVRKSLGGNPMPVRVRPRAPGGFNLHLPCPSSNIPTLRGNTGNRRVSRATPADARLPPSRGMITRPRCEKWGKSGRCESRLPQKGWWSGANVVGCEDSKPQAEGEGIQHSLAEDCKPLPVTSEQTIELDSRLTAYESDKDRGRLAADVLADVRRR